ncbi:uncharacterized protein LOC110115048 [Dendrobium catenatum]|uniref:uncharacterized protein LOC110115048 n=1 Tax=Dendrobium catenatum TaxID=906689 RepID=UPI00109F7D9A|nr:uncharacterized protein LOC110115048 [Dendrobium catenatum]
MSLLGNIISFLLRRLYIIGFRDAHYDLLLKNSSLCTHAEKSEKRRSRCEVKQQQWSRRSDSCETRSSCILSQKASLLRIPCWTIESGGQVIEEELRVRAIHLVSLLHIPTWTIENEDQATMRELHVHAIHRRASYISPAG